MSTEDGRRSAWESAGSPASWKRFAVFLLPSSCPPSAPGAPLPKTRGIWSSLKLQMSRRQPGWTWREPPDEPGCSTPRRSFRFQSKHPAWPTGRLAAAPERASRRARYAGNRPSRVAGQRRKGVEPCQPGALLRASLRQAARSSPHANLPRGPPRLLPCWTSVSCTLRRPRKRSAGWRGWHGRMQPIRRRRGREASARAGCMPGDGWRRHWRGAGSCGVGRGALWRQKEGSRCKGARRDRRRQSRRCRIRGRR